MVEVEWWGMRGVIKESQLKLLYGVKAETVHGGVLKESPPMSPPKYN